VTQIWLSSLAGSIQEWYQLLMFIKRSSRTINGRQYHHYLLVESVRTEKGPRQKVICSLGNMQPGPPEKWKELARKLDRALSGQLLIEEQDESLQELVAHVESAKSKTAAESDCEPTVLPVKINEVKNEDAREAGPVHVGHSMWNKLGINEILTEAGLSQEQQELAEILTLNRLVEPTSEHATPDWVARTAIPDLLGEKYNRLNYRLLYDNLDKLHPQREFIENALFQRERTLFNLNSSVYLYDLTSTYFEGACELNPAAKHGYSRDSRPDCRQVVVGLILNGDGFPTGHEIFDGNRVDCTTVEEMLAALARRTGNTKGLTVVVDRGMSDQTNLDRIKAAGHHYLVAAKQTERLRWLAEFEEQAGWTEISENGSISGTGVFIKRFERAGEVYLLCISEGRKEKDLAIRQKQEKRLRKDLAALEKRIKSGSPKTAKKVFEAIGRLKERYPRVNRYWLIDYDEKTSTLITKEDEQRRRLAEQVDGAYVLRTSRMDMTDQEVWKQYMMLTRVEAAFRDMKSPLAVRPVYHQLQNRVEAHIFVCVLAYHLLVAIERLLQASGITSSWETVRKQLSTHQTVSTILPSTSGKILEIRRDTEPNNTQKDIYAALGIADRILSVARRRWLMPA
jgi:transposase